MKRALGWLQRLGKNLSFLRGNLLILTLSWMVWYPALRMLEPYDKLYMQDLGATPLIIGGITALSTVVETPFLQSLAFFIFSPSKF